MKKSIPKIIFWTQLTFWIVLVSMSIEARISFQAPSGANGWDAMFLKGMYLLYIIVAVVGILISALITLTARCITYRPRYNETAVFERGLNVATIVGWSMLLLPLILFAIAPENGFLLFSVWLACAMLCAGLLVISKVKELGWETNPMKKALQIAFWVQLILWLVFLLISIAARISFWLPPNANGTDKRFMEMIYNLSVSVSSAGVLTSALVALMVKCIHYQPSSDKMTAFDRCVKRTVAAGWVLFFVPILPAILFTTTEHWFLLPALWLACAVLCAVLWVAVKRKETKQRTNP